ncbi:MAG: glycosyltransferase [Planctomycetes bacterium]|nr:glycosyltransferase [Planctomycetota bacterium]
MRILIVSPYFPPQQAAASLRLHALAETWAQAGEQVTILTTQKQDDQRSMPLPCDGFTVVEIPYRISRILQRLRSRDHAPGTLHELVKKPSPIAKTLRAIKNRTGIYSTIRMPDLTDSWVAPAIQWARDNGRWDFVISSSGPYTAHLVALALRQGGEATHWGADFRDLWTQNPGCRGLFPFTIRERALERQCLAAADCVTTVSESLAESLRRQARGPVSVIYNGYRENEIESLPPESFFPTDGMTNLVYTGTVYPGYRDAMPLLGGMARLKARRANVTASLRLHVAGPLRDHWQRLTKKYGVQDMTQLYGVLPRVDALRMQRDADGLVVTAWCDPAAGLASKLFEYLVARAPILVIGAGPDDPIAHIVQKAGRGVSSENDVDAIADVLKTLCENPQSLSPNPDAQYIRQFSRTVQATRLLVIMQELSSQPS